MEERPFQRVTRNLLGKHSVLRAQPSQLPSPPPEDGNVASLNYVAQGQKLGEDILLDFSALEASIVRIQLLQSSNQRECGRYAAEKAKILETAQAVKENTVGLRTQLARVQELLELRKGYDLLAKSLINPEKLKPRERTREEIAKLEKEIQDVRQESADLETTWLSRKEAFNRVAAEGTAAVRLIKGLHHEGAAGEKDDPMEVVEESDSVNNEGMPAGTPALDGCMPLPPTTDSQTPTAPFSEMGVDGPTHPVLNSLNGIVDFKTSDNLGPFAPSQRAESQSEPKSGDVVVATSSGEQLLSSLPQAELADDMDET